MGLQKVGHDWATNTYLLKCVNLNAYRVETGNENEWKHPGINTAATEKQGPCWVEPISSAVCYQIFTVFKGNLILVLR